MRPFSWLLLSVCALTFSAPSRAAADLDETEKRLKSPGVDAALRKRIHRAIDRSVAFLRSRQRESGSFRGDTRFPQFRTGLNALCALALRHADTKEGRAGAARAITWLTGADGKGRPSTRQRSYTGGITAMLLHADRSHRAWGHTIARNIAVRPPPRRRGAAGSATACWPPGPRAQSGSKA